MKVCLHVLLWLVIRHNGILHSPKIHLIGKIIIKLPIIYLNWLITSLISIKVIVSCLTGLAHLATTCFSRDLVFILVLSCYGITSNRKTDWITFMLKWFWSLGIQRLMMLYGCVVTFKTFPKLTTHSHTVHCFWTWNLQTHNTRNVLENPYKPLLTPRK